MNPPHPVPETGAWAARLGSETFPSAEPPNRTELSGSSYRRNHQTCSLGATVRDPSRIRTGVLRWKDGTPTTRRWGLACSVPYANRTRVDRLRICRPGPLDERDKDARGESLKVRAQSRHPAVQSPQPELNRPLRITKAALDHRAVRATSSGAWDRTKEQLGNS